MSNQHQNFFIKEGSLQEIVALSQQIPEFENPHPIAEYERRLKAVPHLILVAYDKRQPVGFKVGYEKEGYFYSWMGGILPAYRRNNLATFLAERQEIWVKENGYLHIIFKTRNYLKPMLIFALERGFNIIAVEEREPMEENRILLQKRL